jgi:hypothetical protein
MKNPRSIGLTILGLGASLAASRAAIKHSKGFGELDEAMGLGYSPENALPIAGQPGFPDSAGVDCAEALRSIVHPKALADSDAA